MPIYFQTGRNGGSLSSAGSFNYSHLFAHLNNYLPCYKETYLARLFFLAKIVKIYFYSRPIIALWHVTFVTKINESSYFRNFLFPDISAVLAMAWCLVTTWGSSCSGSLGIRMSVSLLCARYTAWAGGVLPFLCCFRKLLCRGVLSPDESRSWWMSSPVLRGLAYSFGLSDKEHSVLVVHTKAFV